MHVLHVVRHRVKNADISFQIGSQTYPVMRCIDDSQYLAISCERFTKGSLHREKP